MKRLAQAQQHEDEPPSSKAKVNQEGKGKFMGKGKGKFKGKGKLFMMMLQQYEGHPEVCVYRKPAKKGEKKWLDSGTKILVSSEQPPFNHDQFTMVNTPRAWKWENDTGYVKHYNILSAEQYVQFWQQDHSWQQWMDHNSSASSTGIWSPPEPLQEDP